jgi:protein-L-isoaspartate(D-aspartate) O-methyltransferase
MCVARSTAGRFVAFVLLALGVVAPLAVADDEAKYARLRKELAADIAAMANDTAADTGRARFDPRVMQALGSVPRHAFVPAGEIGNAYDNRPLDIGYGQTISQPYIVALMTDLVAPQPGHKVLEIGTGSGYQAAIFSGLVDRVYTIEIVKPLAEQATERLQRLGYKNVSVKVADGYYGWEEQAPFDSIVVTAAATSIPPPLIKQLKPGGVMVIPVGAPFMTQTLVLVRKNADGTVSTRQLLAVAFVPLTGKH